MKTFDELIAEEAHAIAERENEASSFCGPYGTDTAADYIDDVRKHFVEVGEAYIRYGRAVAGIDK